MPLSVITSDDFQPRSLTEARDHFLRKAPLLAGEWDRLTTAQKARAFRMAAVHQVKLLQAIRGKLAEAIAEGRTYRQWRQEVLAEFKQAGVDAPALSRLRTTFFENARGAHSEARRESLDAARGTFPYRQYLTQRDQSVRAKHATLDQKVFRSDDPFWLDHTPPWEWGCRCFDVPLTANQVESRGFTVWTYSGGEIRPVDESGTEDAIPVPRDANYSARRGELDLTELDDDLRAAIEERMREAGETPLMHDKLFPVIELVLQREDAGKDTRDFVLLPDGQVTTTKGNFLVDRHSFAEVEKAFRAKGNDILVDYEHQSLGGEYAPPDGRSLASGWIKQMRYEDGKGIVATVKWTPAAMGHIKNGEYRYHSPVVQVRKSDGRAVAVQSAGLTNTPAIERLPALAAKDVPQKGAAMNGNNGTPGADPAQLVGELKALLGIEIKDSSDMVAVLSAIRDEIKKRDGQKAPDGTALSNVRKTLGLADGASESEITVSINTLRQAKDSTSSLQEEVKALKTQMQQRDVTEFLSPYVLKGVIGEHNTDDLKAMQQLALTNRDLAKKWLDERVSQMGHQTALTRNAGDTPPAGRATIIAKAKSDYAASIIAQRGTSLKAYVNLALTDAKSTELTEDEIKTLAA